MHVTREFSAVKFSVEVIEKAIEELGRKAEGSPFTGNTYSAQSGLETWSFDNVDEWYAAYGRDDCDGAHLSLGFGDKEWIEIRYAYGTFTSTSISIGARSRERIERTMRLFTNAAPSNIIEVPSVFQPESEPDPEPDPERPVVFIGHGRSSDWRELKDELQDKHGYEVVAYETGARAGHSIRDILTGMLRSSNFALLVMAAEDETTEGGWRARQNVVHEAGLFQGKLGFGRAIAIIEQGVEVFTNLDGVQHIPYPKGHVKNAISEILATLHREFEGQR